MRDTAIFASRNCQTPDSVNWNYERHNGIQALAEELECEYIEM